MIILKETKKLLCIKNKDYFQCYKIYFTQQTFYKTSAVNTSPILNILP